MFYSIKLDDQGLAKLRTDTGLPNCRINLTKGIIQVSKKDDIQAVAAQYGIDNIDYVPYQEFMSSIQSSLRHFQPFAAGCSAAKRDVTPRESHNRETQTAGIVPRNIPIPI